MALVQCISCGEKIIEKEDDANRLEVKKENENE